MLLIEREIVRLILSCVGVSNVGTVANSGILLKKNAIDADFVLTDDAGMRQTVSAWSGQTTFGLQGCLCEILAEYKEYFFVYKLKEENEVIGVGHVYHDNGTALFIKYKEGKWTKVSLKERLIIASEFVSLVDSGLIWKPNDDNKFLLSSLKELITL